MSNDATPTEKAPALTTPAAPLNVPQDPAPEPVVEETPEVVETPAAEEEQPEMWSDDDFSDLLGDDDVDDEEPEKPERAPEKPGDEPPPEIDYTDPEVVRQIAERQQALERKLAEREQRDAAAAAEAAQDRVAEDIDKAVHDYKMTKDEVKAVYRYMRDRDLIPNVLSGKLSFDDVVGFADPSIKARAKAAAPPANRPAAPVQPKAPPAKKPDGQSNGAPSSTFADATAAARREGWIGKLSKS